MSNPDESESLNLQTYKRDLVNQLLAELFHIVQTEEREKGHDFADEFVMSLLQSYVATCVFNSLRNGAKTPAPDPQAQYANTLRSFGRMKVMLQEAIAQGFATGWTGFNPQSTPDYLCTVKPLDDGLARGKAN